MMHRGNAAPFALQSAYDNVLTRDSVPFIHAVHRKIQYSGLTVLSLCIIICVSVLTMVYMHTVYCRVQSAYTQMQLRIEQDNWVASKCQDIEFRERLPDVCSAAGDASESAPNALHVTDTVVFVIDVLFDDCAYMISDLSDMSYWTLQHWLGLSWWVYCCVLFVVAAAVFVRGPSTHVLPRVRSFGRSWWQRVFRLLDTDNAFDGKRSWWIRDDI